MAVDVLGDVVQQVAADMVARGSVRIEAAGLPTMTVKLSDADGKPGLLMRALRPRITLMEGERVLATVAPAGDPEQGPPWGAVILGGLVLTVGVGVWLALR